MKTIAIKALLVFSAFFVMGEVVGMSTTEASATGGAATFISAFAKSPEAALRVGFDISEITAQLGDYWRKYEKMIWREITNDLELEKFCRKVPKITDEYVTTRSENTELLQPFQKTTSFKGDTIFTPYINKVRQIKIDYKLDCMDDLYKSYLEFMADETKLRKDWPLVKYIVMFHIIPGIREELDLISGQGVYLAPAVPGTPGASIDSADGFLTIVTNEIAGGDIVPIITGATTINNAVDNFETFNDALPTKYRKLPGTIFCSPTLATYYKRDYRNTFGAQNDQAAKDNLMIDASRKNIVGVNAFEGSQRMLYTPKENMLVMYDKIYALNKFDIQLFERDVKIFGDFKRGYGFGTLKNVFANDQA